jgi:hypothetical protein
MHYINCEALHFIGICYVKYVKREELSEKRYTGCLL